MICGVTWVSINEVASGDWAIGGDMLVSEISKGDRRRTRGIVRRAAPDDEATQ
ncbi:hypothetical protein C7476_12328 [Phyllobacterium bourgognense]|uniref:4-oxalocrotonate tautomerase n=1 Tax=Phyllobacterium bourgognense TaxID=314236 RepID=A0A368YG33_9HYPH|nr:hypothetical protein C7476_12328 [Phyllobacterium bourgognense]